MGDQKGEKRKRKANLFEFIERGKKKKRKEKKENKKKKKKKKVLGLFCRRPA